MHFSETELGFFMLLSMGLMTGLSHCVGMCGPLVVAFSMRRRAAEQDVVSPLVMFQMGRLTTYLILGGVVGAIGGALNLAALLRGWQGYLSLGLGALLVLMGLGLSGRLSTRRWLESSRLAGWVSHWMQRFLATSHPLAPFGLGLTNGLLPCGPVYALLLLVAAMGNPRSGLLTMLLFGLGTLLPLLGMGLSVSHLSLRWRRALFQGSALLVVMVGTQLMLRGLASHSLIGHLAVGGVMLW